MPYTKKDIAESLERLSIKKGDLLFIHSNIGFFGRLKEATSSDKLCFTFFDAILNQIGKNGTIAVPAFTYSFPKNEVFNLDLEIKSMGIFSEWLRNRSDSFRSLDPSYSIVAYGEKAQYLTKDAPINSFGEDSFFNRFDKENGAILNLNFDAGSTYLHYLEREFNVPYRFDKTFEGYIEEKKEKYLSKSTIYVRYMNDFTFPKFEEFDNIARKQGKFETSDLGRGQIGFITAKDCKEIISEQLSINPYILTKGHFLNKMPKFKEEQVYVPIN